MKFKGNNKHVKSRIIAIFKENWIKIVIYPFFAIVILVLYNIFLEPNIKIPSIIPVSDDKKVFNSSIQSFKDGNYKNSISEAKQLIVDYPNSRYIQDAMYNIGVAYRNMQNYVRSREAYKDLLKNFPETKHKVQTQYNLKELSVLEAKALFKEKEYSQAYDEFNRLATNNELKEFSDLQAEVKDYIVSCLIKLRKYDEALDYSEEIVTQLSNNKSVVYALYISGHLNYTLKKNYEQALLYFQKLLDQYPESSYIGHAAVGLVLSLRKLNSDDEIQSRIKDLNERFPQNKWVTNLKAYAEGLKQSSYAVRDIASWEQAKAQKDARTAFRRVLEYNENYLDLKVNTRYNIAKSYLDEYKYAQARLEFDKILTSEFSSWNKLQEKAMYHAAFCLKQQNIHDEALSRYTEFLTRFPNSEYVADAYFDRGKIYTSNENASELARSNFERALKTTDNPERKAEILIEIGFTYMNQNRPEKALTAFNQLLKEYQDSPQAATAEYMIAQIHIDDQEYDKVVEVHENIIRNYNKDKELSPMSLTWADGRPAYNVNLIAISHLTIGEASLKKKDYEKAFLSNVRILKEPENEEMDLRTDPSAPNAMYYAMNALNELWKQEEIRSDIKAELGELLDLPTDSLLDINIENLLRQFANNYINYLDTHNESLSDIDAKLENTILKAIAQFEYAKMLFEMEKYVNAVSEYARLQEYEAIPAPMLDLIKLKSKFYEGRCNEELSRATNMKTDYAKESEKAYQETITLFEAYFQPLIDQGVDIPNINRKMLKYCIQTALYYAGNSYFAIKQYSDAIDEFQRFLDKANPESEFAEDAHNKIKEARQGLNNKPKKNEKSNNLDNSSSLEKSKTTRQLTAEEIAKIGRDSTVLLALEYIEGKEVPSGSGFFIRSDLIVTNYHVIEGAIRGTARLVRNENTLSGVQTMSFPIVGYTAIHHKRDLAILKVRNSGVKPLVLGNNSEDLSINDIVYAIGNPLGKSHLQGTVSEGKISGIRKDYKGKWIQMTAPISPGNSGGPVLDRLGKVVGVSTLEIWDSIPLEYDVTDSKGEKIGSVKLPRRAQQSLNFAIPVEDLEALLNRVGPPKPLSDL